MKNPPISWTVFTWSPHVNETPRNPKAYLRATCCGTRSLTSTRGKPDSVHFMLQFHMTFSRSSQFTSVPVPVPIPLRLEDYTAKRLVVQVPWSDDASTAGRWKFSSVMTREETITEMISCRPSPQPHNSQYVLSRNSWPCIAWSPLEFAHWPRLHPFSR